MESQNLDHFDHAKDRRVQRTISAIHEAFLELAAEKNIEKITVSAVSDRANINRKTFYLHYASIEDLIEEILYDEIATTSEHISHHCLDDEGRLDVNALFSELSLEMIRSFNERAEIYKHVDSKWLIDHIEPLLTDALVANDTLQLADTLGPYLKYCVTFYCAGLMSVYHRWIDDESELPMDTLTKYLSAAIEGGVFALAEQGKPNAK